MKMMRVAGFCLPPKPNGRRGMTLIELLVSLAIIAIMTGIAFPIFSYYQKRNLVDSDIKNFVQLFNYARALQNNPDNFARIADQNQSYSYVIKLKNSGGDNSATLYLSVDGVIDESVVIDKVDFSENMSVKQDGRYPISGQDLTSNYLTLSFSGTPPKEVITCAIISSGYTLPLDCNTYIDLSLTSKGLGQITRTARILNPMGAAGILSINVE